MIGDYFYHETVKSAIGAFGSIFSDITIKRRDGKVIKVPVAYGPREKWLEAAEKNLDKQDELFENLLPRISFEPVAMTYDAQRKLTNKQKMVGINGQESGSRQRVFAPVPYTVDFTLSIAAKNLNDGWQIVEQILPFFRPAYTLEVTHFPEEGSENTFDMPITLTAVTWADDYIGEIGDRRFIEWTLEFSAKIYLHGPVGNRAKIIYDARSVLSVPQNIKTVKRGDDTQEGIEIGHAVVGRDSEIYWRQPDSETMRRVKWEINGQIYDSEWLINTNISYDSDLDNHISDSEQQNIFYDEKISVTYDERLEMSGEQFITNIDSEGNVVKVIRDIEHWFEE